ncbi:MAG: hypothetical protein LBC64_02995 [Fibromonadaceae bacterium]|jgi:hypothetical protein|nr:hypothetical protein [Fibromonadaceae bacterium]
MSGVSSVNSAAFNYIQANKERFGTGAKVGNIKLPNFKKAEINGAYTKTESSMSDEELKEAIVKTAKEDAAKGEFQTTKAFLDLKKEYISSVSPDREGIITNSTKKIFDNKNTAKFKNEKIKTLLEILLEAEKKGDKKKKDDENAVVNMKSDDYFASFDGDKLSYVAFYDSNGDIIAEYSQNGWAHFQTKEESARRHEICSIYNEAWSGAKNGPKHLEGGTTIDAYA